MIEIIGTELYQWDVKRSVSVTGASHVHFANQGDSKAVIMELTDSQAIIPNYLLQTGKQLCVYAVKDGVTIERKTFSVKKRERPENYVYDDDQRNYIYELITSAENAVENANLATKNANDAADKALQAANSWVMVGEVSGESIAVSDAANHTLMGLRIFGKTTQDGTPTPDAPVDLVSVGDSGSITVDVANGEDEPQSMTIATPNGLPGIPVTSGGNYTDANGQQWICDEVDFGRGVYVQRTEKVDIGTFVWEYDSVNGRFLTNSINTKVKRGTRATPMLTSVGYDCKYRSEYLGMWDNAIYIAGPTLYIHDANYNTVDAFAAAVDEVILLYPFEAPIEIPLSETELAAYASLHTYKDSTTVSNDASAHMELEYVMDAKKYIDSLMTGTIIQASVE